MRQTDAARKTRSSAKLQPAWDVALLFPPQGEWTEIDYLALDTERRVELSDGYLEVLPMPTIWHQFIASFLFQALLNFVKERGLGIVLFSGTRVWLGKRRMREPDIVFLKKSHESRIHSRYFKGADLAMEVVSPDKKSRQRDLITKRSQYARAGIPEYWIVDPQKEKILVLRLSGNRYVIHGEFGRGSRAESHLLPGFGVSVDETFDSGKAFRGKTKQKRNTKKNAK